VVQSISKSSLIGSRCLIGLDLSSMLLAGADELIEYCHKIGGPTRASGEVRP
jgi:hypothetical protein